MIKELLNKTNMNTSHPEVFKLIDQNTCIHVFILTINLYAFN